MENNKTTRYIFILSMLFFFSLTSIEAQIESLRMFHIERNKNNSIVCYDLEINEKSIDTKKPVHAYWEMPDKNNSRNELSAIQNKLAFGFTIEKIDGNSVFLKLKAYPQRILNIVYEPDSSEAKVFALINGIHAVLNKLYIHATPPLYNSVEYIILTGINPLTGEVITERINNG